MPYAPVIVCEKTGRWAAALRGSLRQDRVSFVETRSLSQCAEALRASPVSLVAVEVTAPSLEPAASFIARACRSCPAARIVVLLDAEVNSAQPLLREAGAVEVLLSVGEMPALARLARRHLALVPPQKLGLRKAIAERLPWKRSQTPAFAAKLPSPSAG